MPLRHISISYLVIQRREKFCVVWHLCGKWHLSGRHLRGFHCTPFDCSVRRTRCFYTNQSVHVDKLDRNLFEARTRWVRTRSFGKVCFGFQESDLHFWKTSFDWLQLICLTNGMTVFKGLKGGNFAWRSKETKQHGEVAWDHATIFDIESWKGKGQKESKIPRKMAHKLHVASTRLSQHCICNVLWTV